MSAQGGRPKFSADVQNPVHAVKQIRDAHKQMLALSRNHFAKTPNDTELYAQSQPVGQTNWQHDNDAQHDQRSLDSISELSDARYQNEHLPPDASHPAEQSQARVQELQQQNDHLSRQLVVLNHDMDKQQHEQFKMRQEQQLQFDDLRQHTSNLESQLQQAETSTDELLSVNSFLDTELRKHKDWLEHSRQTSTHCRHLFKQEEHEKAQLAQQLHDTQAQLAETWRESSHMQELVAELQGQTAAAADHQARVRDLTDANGKLEHASGQLHQLNGELLNSTGQLEEANRDLQFQLEGLRSALADSFQDTEAAQRSFAQQQAEQAAVEHEHSQTEVHMRDVIGQLERQVAALDHQLDEVRFQEHQRQGAITQRAQQDSQLLQRLAQLTQANEQLEEHVMTLNQQLQQAQHQVHQVQDSSAAQHAQQAAEAADTLSHLSVTNKQIEEHNLSLQRQLRQAQCELQGAQESFTDQQAQQASGSADRISALSTAKEQLEAQIAELTNQLGLSEQQLQQAQSLHRTQLAQQAGEHDSALTQLVDANKDLEDTICSLDRQVRQTQQDLHAGHESHQDQRAQQAKVEAGRLAESQTHNTQLQGDHSSTYELCHADMVVHKVLAFSHI